MGVSNNIIAFLNFCSLVCSVPIIASGVWLANRADYECVGLARWPVILLGVLVLLVSLAGFVGAYWNRQGLLAAYLFLMAALIVLFLIFLVFAFVVTRTDGSYAVPGRASREYRVDGFSMWLRHYATDPENWGRIRRCLVDSDVCGKLARNDAYYTADQFFQLDLSPLQASSSLTRTYTTTRDAVNLQQHAATAT
ncbi:putative tetraspanin-2 [Iris pallida]|uniref:Tetraspanin-2 n=1 Tax=Iris pallida TaxID=29817 RepID=A0AAX6EM40_IRIPA|nr:putative tetraspanin-2 [Iris pallida]